MRMHRWNWILAVLVGLLCMGCQGIENLADRESLDDTGEQKVWDSQINRLENVSLQVSLENIAQDIQKQTYCGIQDCSVLEDTDYYYTCTLYEIRRIQKETGITDVLWESGAKGGNGSRGCKGGGILLFGNLYFVEAVPTAPGEEEKYAFAVLERDPDKGYYSYKRLSETTVGANPGLYYSVMDQIIYYHDCFREYQDGRSEITDRIYCYKLLLNGSRIEINGASTPYGYMQESYWEVPYQFVEGGFESRLSIPESLERYGCILYLNEDRHLVKLWPGTGEELLLEDEVILCLGSDSYLSYRTGEKPQRLYLTKVTTGESHAVAGMSSGSIFGMDEEYVYQYRSLQTDKGGCLFEKISLATGECIPLFELDRVRLGYPYNRPGLAWRMTLRDGYLYYGDDFDGTDCRDGGMYLVRRSLEQPEEAERIGDAYYDSGICLVGSVQEQYEFLYSQTEPEVVLTDLELEWLQVDGEYPGAMKINDYLEKEMAQLAVGARDLEQQEEMLQEYGTGYYNYYQTGLSGISYFDGRFFSFCQEGETYLGGAHGMPYREGYVFDLQTGERLFLEDIVSNSEEELKRIVTSHYAAYIGQNESYFWKDALDTVQSQAGFDSDFYLKEDGIAFFFPPYALTCFAGGFQEVTIPYREFAMQADKIFGHGGRDRRLIDYTSLEDVLSKEDWASLSAYLPLLRQEARLYWTDGSDMEQMGNVTVKEFWERDFVEVLPIVITEIALVDMDGDGVTELICKSPRYGTRYFILHAENGTFYGMDIWVRQFFDLQTNGVYVSSNSAANTCYWKLWFDGADKVFRKERLGEEDGWGEEHSYWIGEEEVEEESYREWEEGLRVGNAVWYEVTQGKM